MPTARWSLLDRVPESLLVLDAKGRITFVNRCFRSRVTSFSVIGLSFVRDLVKDCDKGAVTDSLAQAQSSCDDVVDVECEVLIVAANNSFPEFASCALQVMAGASTEAYTVVSLRRLRVEVRAAKCRDDDVLDFIENAPIALQWLSETGHVLWCNQTALDLLGYTAEEYIGKHMYAFSMDAEDVLQRNFNILKNGGVMHNHSSDWRTKSGDIRRVLIDSSIHFDSNGKFRNTRCFIRDDTARQIQQARMAAEQASAIDSMQSQDRFMRKVLHEIRTPCNIVLHSLGEPASVEAQMQKLLRIVKDVEDAHAFDSGKALALRPSAFNLPALVREIFWRQAADYRSPDVMRSIALADGGSGGGSGGGGGGGGGAAIPCDVVTDRTCLVRVLTHLIDNAMRFTQTGVVRFEFGGGSGAGAGGARGSSAGCAVATACDKAGGSSSVASGKNTEVGGRGCDGGGSCACGELCSCRSGGGGCCACSVRGSSASTCSCGCGASSWSASADAGPICGSSSGGNGVERGCLGSGNRVSIEACSTCSADHSGSTTTTTSRSCHRGPTSGGSSTCISSSGGSGSGGGGGSGGSGGTSAAQQSGDSNGVSASSGAKRKISFAISNTGKPLDTELVHQHFQKYWTGKGDSGLFGEDGEGIGVGLNICFNIIQCLGSELVVTSENGVNTFRFELDVPVLSTVEDFDFSRPSSYDFVRKQDRSPSLNQQSRWIDVEDAPASAMHVLNPREELPPEAAPVSTACVAGNQEPRRPHILVVDDNTICQKLLCRTLRTLDCTTSVAGNGKEACEMVRCGGAAARAFDMVFMDLRMPVCDGIQATTIMRRELHVETPIVALSADNTDDIRQRCSAAGMQDFCAKPATKQQINDVIKSYVKL